MTRRISCGSLFRLRFREAYSYTLSPFLSAFLSLRLTGSIPRNGVPQKAAVVQQRCGSFFRSRRQEPCAGHRLHGTRITMTVHHYSWPGMASRCEALCGTSPGKLAKVITSADDGTFPLRGTIPKAPFRITPQTEYSLEPGVLSWSLIDAVPQSPNRSHLGV